MFQIKSTGTLELEYIFVSSVVLWCGHSIFHSFSCQVSVSCLSFVSSTVLCAKSIYAFDWIISKCCAVIVKTCSVYLLCHLFWNIGGFMEKNDYFPSLTLYMLIWAPLLLWFCLLLSVDWIIVSSKIYFSQIDFRSFGFLVVIKECSV